MGRKKVMIVFAEDYFAYSPTAYNLFVCLQLQSEVSVLTFEPSAAIADSRLSDKRVEYLKAPRGISSFPRRMLLRILRQILPAKNTLRTSWSLSTPKSRLLTKKITQFDGEIIAIDFFALWSTQQAGKAAHFVSLEILPLDPYRDACQLSKIKSVMIQRVDRYDSLFVDIKPPAFIVQNAPCYIEMGGTAVVRSKFDLVFAGTVVSSFGIFSCLEFLRDFPPYRLTLKGHITLETKEAIDHFYRDLIEENRLIFNETYVSDTSLTSFLSEFRIGLVFYDVYRFANIRILNYLTAPSGKMFQYFNSGVPCIGNDIAGLSVIAENDAGILIKSLGSLQIKAAIDKIETDYEFYAANAKAASRRYDFKMNVQPFIDFILFEKNLTA